MMEKKNINRTGQYKKTWRQRRSDKASDREENKLEEAVLEIRRVTRVMAGGKRFSFRSTVVLGDKNGKVGVGIGKGSDVADSIRKAKDDASNKMLSFRLKDKRTIPYDVEVKYGAARVRIKPTKNGHGLIAGGAVRVVLELAGIKDISAKTLGNTKNKINNAMATMKALEEFKITTKYENNTEIQNYEKPNVSK